MCSPHFTVVSSTLHVARPHSSLRATGMALLQWAFDIRCTLAHTNCFSPYLCCRRLGKCATIPAALCGLSVRLEQWVAEFVDRGFYRMLQWKTWRCDYGQTHSVCSPKSLLLRGMGMSVGHSARSGSARQVTPLPEVKGRGTTDNMWGSPTMSSLSVNQSPL